MQATSHRFITCGDARAYTLAGNATITLESAKTGARYTYKVRVAKEGNVHFVSLLSGPNNETDFQYMGIIKQVEDGLLFFRTKASKISIDAPSWKAFNYYWSIVRTTGDLPAALIVRHSGKCGHCGRELTEPESIDLGIGPICRAKMGLE